MFLSNKTFGTDALPYCVIIGSQPTYINVDEELSQPFQASPDILASQLDINNNKMGEKEKEREKQKKRKRHIQESKEEEGGGEQLMHTISRLTCTFVLFAQSLLPPSHLQPCCGLVVAS